jgi:hypothetical protein
MSDKEASNKARNSQLTVFSRNSLLSVYGGDYTNKAKNNNINLSKS